MIISIGAIISWIITFISFGFAFYKSSKVRTGGYMDFSILEKGFWYGIATIISLLSFVVSLNIG